LMGILGLPNLPIEFPASPACQAVASVCKSILVSSSGHLCWRAFLNFHLEFLDLYLKQLYFS
jgi:E3 ubiquitin-protein ligase HUWE1